MIASHQTLVCVARFTLRARSNPKELNRNDRPLHTTKRLGHLGDPRPCLHLVWRALPRWPAKLSCSR